MTFAKHQSFYLRDGWLRKGLVAVRDDPAAFLGQEAPARLGLGENMVVALRYWLTAFQVTEEVREGSRWMQRLTPLGQHVLAHDPYLEQETTLWLLHAQLATNAEGATTWFWFFNHFARPTFTKTESLRALRAWAARDREVAEKSLERDFDCLVQTSRRERES
jgi:hypothetical protein